MFHWGKVKALVHLTEIRTRYCESDALGHINNVSYFIYFEQARVDFFAGQRHGTSIREVPVSCCFAAL